jgi:malyl-CoA/(S)-citramalyl-CoA lyase
VIHPSQIEPTRKAFVPSDQELTDARRTIAAMEAAERAGQGAVTLDGKMIDYANLRMVQRLLRFQDPD